jgi:hypothetical protein
VIVLDPSDQANVTVTWDNLGSATISSVSYTAPVGLTVTAQGNTPTTSTFRVSGLAHGLTYQVEAQATLSSGEVLNRNIPIRGFNG